MKEVISKKSPESRAEQKVLVTGLIDTGSDIINNRDDLFSHTVKTVLNLQTQNLVLMMNA